MRKSVSSIIRRCSQNIRACRQAIQVNLRLDPYSTDYDQLAQLGDRVYQNEVKANRLQFNEKIPPSVSICTFLPSLTGTVAYLGSQNVGQDSLLLYLLRSQKSANDMIRELNQLGVEEKSVREVVIGFRNCVEEYTENKKLNSRIGKLVKQIV